jgi:hypothetical protein
MLVEPRKLVYLVDTHSSLICEIEGLYGGRVKNPNPVGQ